MNIYAPNSPRGRKNFFDKLWQYKPGDDNLIVGGDFNCIEEPDLDKQGGNPVSGTSGVEELKQFVQTNDLFDTWRENHPTVHLAQ